MGWGGGWGREGQRMCRGVVVMGWDGESRGVHRYLCREELTFFLTFKGGSDPSSPH